ncbi:MAG: hypothetical protein U0U09_18750 [Cyclobacteriaceae bacterium]
MSKKGKSEKEQIPRIVNLLQQKLNSILPSSGVQIKQLDSPAMFGLIAAGVEYIYDEEAGHKVAVIPVRNETDADYWISLFLSTRGATFEVDNIGIAVYSGAVSDPQKTKMFRAEWSINKEHSHAQPHWHFHTEDFPAKNPEVWTEEESPKSFSAELLKSQGKLKKIHFAMAAQWHDNGDSHVLDLKGQEEKHILNWVSGTFRYILFQLSYLENKSGSY